jgi:hypothetical protein
MLHGHDRIARACRRKDGALVHAGECKRDKTQTRLGEENG